MRTHSHENLYFVTNRCEEERFFLLPKPNVNQLIGSWLAKALDKYGDGIEIYAFIFMSNHLHILLRDTKGQLAKFMWYFQLNLAKAINRECLGRRRGHFFSREYDATPVLTNEDIEERYAYILTNAVKPGLVAKAADGPFFSSLAAALNDKPFRFTWFDRTRKHNRTRRGQKVDNSEFVKRYEFRLSIPPHWRTLSTRQRRKRIRDLVRANEARYGRERRAEGRGVLGVRRILSQSPLARPRNPARRPRVKVFCKNPEKKEEFLTSLKTTFGLYKQAYQGFVNASKKRRKALLEWPPGCYPPSSMVPIAA